MNSFEQFLKDNRIKKYEIAQYLGIVPSNISVYCGVNAKALPDAHLHSLINNNQGWNVAALIAPSPAAHSEGYVSRAEFEETIAHLLDKIEGLESVMLRQTEVIAEYEAILKTMKP